MEKINAGTGGGKIESGISSSVGQAKRVSQKKSRDKEKHDRVDRV